MSQRRRCTATSTGLLCDKRSVNASYGYATLFR
jgi:hypothetical protein